MSEVVFDVAGDMNYDYIAMPKTFYLSNVAPQYQSFNAG